MLRIFKVGCLALVVLAITGCNLARQMRGGDDVVDSERKNAKKKIVDSQPSVQDEQELKVARLWARVDELEEEVFRQKERMRLLEKGLLTGIAPEALSAAEAPKSKPVPQLELPQLGEHEPQADDQATLKNANELSMAEQEDYGRRIETARGFFTSARYGKAITEYENILTTYGTKVDGGFIKYWIGRSWRQLKEYTTAEEILNEVVEKHASSPWIPRVHYELAKVYIDANNLSAAREKLKFIKNKYQYEDVSELATRELEELPKKL